MLQLQAQSQVSGHVDFSWPPCLLNAAMARMFEVPVIVSAKTLSTLSWGLLVSHN